MVWVVEFGANNVWSKYRIWGKQRVVKETSPNTFKRDEIAMGIFAEKNGCETPIICNAKQNAMRHWSHMLMSMVQNREAYFRGNMLPSMVRKHSNPNHGWTKQGPSMDLWHDIWFSKNETDPTCMDRNNARSKLSSIATTISKRSIATNIVKIHFYGAIETNQFLWSGMFLWYQPHKLVHSLANANPLVETKMTHQRE